MNEVKVSSSSSSAGIGTSGALGVLFVALRLLGIIEWSWWVVLLPFYWWIPIAVIFIFVFYLFLKTGRG